MINFVSENTSSKVNWQGKIVSIQPRTRVWRYLTDNRTHYHLGYNFFIEGHSSDSKKQFTVAISEKQQLKGLFRIDDILEGTAWTKKYEEREFADYYRAGALKLLDRVIRTFVRLKTAILDTEPLARAILRPGATTTRVAARLDSLALRPLIVKARYA